MLKKICNLILLPGLSILLVACARQLPEQKIPKTFSKPKEPLILAHRGGAHIRPENTMPAFEHALELGAHGLELDIHLSRDNQLVVIHDFTVQRTTQGLGWVAKMDVAELKMLDAGHYFSPPDRPQEFPYRGQGIEIPTLKEVLQKFPQTPLCIEIKPKKPEIADMLAQMLRKYERVDNTIVSSFHHQVLERMRKVLPEVATGASKREIRRLYILHRLYLSRLYMPGGRILQLPEKFRSVQLAKPSLIREAQEKGLLVQVWTVNQAKNMRKYLDLKVDGIITDRPDLLLQIIKQRQQIEEQPTKARLEDEKNSYKPINP